MKTLTPVLLLSILATSHSVCAQQAPAPAPPQTANGQPVSSSSDSSKNTTDKVVPSFLILGTVFDERAFALPGVQVRIRKSGEKKFRWETYSNSRGEFAVRVPPGYLYEVFTHMKHYDDQTQNIDSKADVQQRVSIKLQPQSRPKTGAKP
jgi:hypothetical protein